MAPDTLLIPPDGGLQELSGHFENQKVMYGFCSVKDSQAALPKYVLINWVCSYGRGREPKAQERLSSIPLHSLTLLERTPLVPGREPWASACRQLLSFPDTPFRWVLCRLAKMCLMPANVLVPATWLRWPSSSRCEQGQGLWGR